MRANLPGRAGLNLAVLAILTTGQSFAQVPSMLGAPGLSPIPSAPPPATQQPAAPQPGPAVTPPPATAAPEPAAVGIPPQGASSSSCETDLAKHVQRRNGAIAQINTMVQGGKNSKKKIDPAVACPRFRNLVAVESQLLAWVNKNKEWCSIPDQVVDNMKQGFARTPQVAAQACNAAAMVAKMKAQAARQQQQGAPTAMQQPTVKLPTGPL